LTQGRSPAGFRGADRGDCRPRAKNVLIFFARREPRSSDQHASLYNSARVNCTAARAGFRESHPRIRVARRKGRDGKDQGAQSGKSGKADRAGALCRSERGSSQRSLAGRRARVREVEAAQAGMRCEAHERGPARRRTAGVRRRGGVGARSRVRLSCAQHGARRAFVRAREGEAGTSRTRVVARTVSTLVRGASHL
jgi:hypothetical protein